MTGRGIQLPALLCIAMGVIALVTRHLPSRDESFEPVTGTPALIFAVVMLGIGLGLFLKDRAADQDKDDA